MALPKIAVSLDEHDHQQIVLLAKMNRVKPAELVRKILRAYLDRREPDLRKE